MAILKTRLCLQLFADGAGDGGTGNGGNSAAANTGDAQPDAGEARLLALGVPADKIAKQRAYKPRRAVQTENRSASGQQAAAAQEKAPDKSGATDTPEGSKTAESASQGGEQAVKRMSWDEIMADPEYNREMQTTMKARLKTAKDAEEAMQKLAPALELLQRHYGMDGNLDADALSKAISEDNKWYEEKALEMGVSVDVAKKIDQNEREAARLAAERDNALHQQMVANHFADMERQAEELKKTFPNFDLRTELRNPRFFRMTSPGGGVSVADAYYAIHRNEIQAASMQVAAQKTAQNMANAIRAGQARPAESGTTAQAPAVSTFDYAKASKEQREDLKRRIREAAARGEKVYPGQGR